MPVGSEAARRLCCLTRRADCRLEPAFDRRLFRSQIRPTDDGNASCKPGEVGIDKTAARRDCPRHIRPVPIRISGAQSRRRANGGQHTPRPNRLSHPSFAARDRERRSSASTNSAARSTATRPWLHTSEASARLVTSSASWRIAATSCELKDIDCIPSRWANSSPSPWVRSHRRTASASGPPPTTTSRLFFFATCVAKKGNGRFNNAWSRSGRSGRSSRLPPSL